MVQKNLVRTVIISLVCGFIAGAGICSGIFYYRFYRTGVARYTELQQQFTVLESERTEAVRRTREALSAINDQLQSTSGTIQSTINLVRVLRTQIQVLEKLYTDRDSGDIDVNSGNNYSNNGGDK